ncbi:MAG TPA: IS1595 family transposase [bacterium]
MRQGQRGGKVRALHLPQGMADALVPLVRQHILPASAVYTDELPAYTGLKKAGYDHKRVHHAAKVYVQGDAHTNTIDGFWALVKNGISGVYHGVSAKYLQHYLDEFTFRYNNRANPRGIFNAVLSRAVQEVSS